MNPYDKQQLQSARCFGKGEKMANAADTSLPTSEDYCRALLVASSNLVFRVSAEWHVIHDIGGHDLMPDTDSSGGSWLWKYVHPDDRILVSSAINNATGAKCMFEVEHRTLCKDGTSGWTLTRAVPILDSEGHIVEWLGTSLDLTPCKELAQQVARHTKELKTRSHDLARLAEELTMTQYQERRRLADHLHDNLQQLLVAAQMKTKSISFGDELHRGEHLEALAKILSEAIETTRALTRDLAPPLSLSGNLYNAFEWLVHDARERYGVTLQIRLAGNLDEVPEAECVLLYTAARELLTNVVKHSGLLQAHLELIQNHEAIVLTICDAGCGFDTHGVMNTHDGFGLMSIQERVNLIGGRFTVTSDPGRGVQAVVEIPVQTTLPTFSTSTAPITPGKAALNGEPRPEYNKPVSVLLVDDHHIVREALRTLLDAEDSIIILGECGDGRQAVDSTGHLQPEVVIMDINMPVMDGIEATRLIKGQWPLIKVIGLSMYSDVEMGRKIRDAGADAFLTKSAPPEELLETISRCSSRAASRGLIGRTPSQHLR